MEAPVVYPYVGRQTREIDKDELEQSQPGGSGGVERALNVRGVPGVACVLPRSSAEPAQWSPRTEAFSRASCSLDTFMVGRAVLGFCVLAKPSLEPYILRDLCRQRSPDGTACRPRDRSKRSRSMNASRNNRLPPVLTVLELREFPAIEGEIAFCQFPTDITAHGHEATIHRLPLLRLDLPPLCLRIGAATKVAVSGETNESPTVVE